MTPDNGYQGLDPFIPKGGGTDNPGGSRTQPGGPSQNQQTETGFPVTGAGKGRMFPPGGGTDTNPGDPR